MTSAPASPNSVEATTTLLQAELPRLEAHQQSLEKELAAVTERLESVRSALAALTALSGVPHVLEGAEQAEAPAADAAEPAAGKAAAPVASVPAPRRSGAKGEKKAAKKRGAAKKAAPERSSKPAAAKKAAAKKGDESESPSGLTRQVLDILADAKGGTVRARDVAKVLGRDGSPGEINAVRSTLDRLVATSRADRAGRGLYRERA
ncbi:hypothetical protein [Streptomyces montanisoli]|uniref:Uncharacterized protein n=1 Tax=Streptomyces montanisoli TaxID=2798581 RepID=A0A940RXX3_9ACTN|nr:hypothetical protein [Streptomyces montanisoli]MBP0458049.1 hypothetical protein [Streptomyces montanisoli]